MKPSNGWPSEQSFGWWRPSIGSLLVAVALVGLVSAPAGCSQKHCWHKYHAFVTESDAVKYLRTALQDELPDERREAINRIARTRHLKHGVVFEVLDTVARTDPSPSVRCAALSALRRSGNPQAASTFVAILDPDASPEEVRPASPLVRRDALQGMLGLLQAGRLDPEHEPVLRDIVVHLIGGDRSRDIRQASARVLGYLKDRQVLEPLIAALDQRDFGVVYEAERSLMRLTGQTFDHDSIRWRQWLTQTDNPFVDAGKLDHVLAPEGKGWWQRSMECMRRSFGGFGPKKKDS